MVKLSVFKHTASNKIGHPIEGKEGFHLSCLSQTFHFYSYIVHFSHPTGWLPLVCFCPARFRNTVPLINQTPYYFLSLKYNSLSLAAFAPVLCPHSFVPLFNNFLTVFHSNCLHFFTFSSPPLQPGSSRHGQGHP